MSTPQVVELPMERVIPDPEQPRKQFDQETLNGLADSIVKHGLLQPITVRSHPTREGFWMVVAGERRFRAHQIAGKKTIQAIVKDGMDDADLRNTQALENLTRDNMTPSEEALAIERGIAQGQTYEQLSKSLGRSDRALRELHSILQLPRPLLKEVDGNTYPLALAKLIVKFPSNLVIEAYESTKGKSVEVAKRILREMELKYQQTEIFKFTSDEAFVAERNRALDAFGALRVTAATFFQHQPDKMVRFIKNPTEAVGVLTELRDKTNALIEELNKKK